MTCANCGQWMTTTGPAHLCAVTQIEIPPVATGGYVPSELDRLRAENAELREANRTLAHQLERRADGMDPLAVALRASV